MSTSNPLEGFGLRKNQGLIDLLGKSSKNRTSKSDETKDLLSFASKKSADNIKFTHYFLKNRLIKGLDATIAMHLDKNPEMKDNTFIGIVTDDNFRTEVLDLKSAAQSVSDLAEEDAIEVMKKNPVGYFKHADFTMKTSSDHSYQELRDKLNNFFNKNADVFQYLRDNPDRNVEAEDLYKRPSL